MPSTSPPSKLNQAANGIGKPLLATYPAWFLSEPRPSRVGAECLLFSQQRPCYQRGQLLQLEKSQCLKIQTNY
jgi:hypothetical protein